ncbi:hypothetical protein [Chitinophaga sp. LS1]|uniref:hypothetical protein n=1 Tax=Chitinophaga sp. LS1 TaxID=3051176 RepID=UPI002AAAC435|nr:hypothetical protein [Chitinophaga sp. LS1]WPV64035.1 hypothetical protein QQL36_19735 [Chitinophaga sp. LS1]
MNKIQTYIINLKEREDRNIHARKEFSNREEFSLTIVEGIRHENGALGLILTIQKILSTMVTEAAPYIIIGEDDHQFTEHYSKELLFETIIAAENKDADMLLCGISAFKGFIPIDSRLNWVKDFTGTQFVVLFRKCFQLIINAKVNIGLTADGLYTILSNDKYFIYPFISTQKEFGYSDATNENNEIGRITELFEKSATTASLLTKVYSYYREAIPTQPIQTSDYEGMVLPTYIINLPERVERRIHILGQFDGRKEFDYKLIKAVKHSVGAYGLWQTIRKIIHLAIENDDEVILICEDDHEFSADYSRDFLFKNILEAHLQGADYISGGSGGFDYALPITENRFWVNPCYSTQFIIIYKKFFQQILDEPYDETVIADILLPSMTSNKMLLYPFISFQKDFGYSDVTPLHHEYKGLITRIFSNSEKALALHQDIYIRHCK